MVGVERRTDQRRDVVDVFFRYRWALPILESDQVITVPRALSLIVAAFSLSLWLVALVYRVSTA
ncbi:hypothetical protein VCR14J2_610176 [Vibrio coralliirubri]|nr:hypothetical protein VCR14J2_610176 [Vibrio coralliirubri]